MIAAVCEACGNSPAAEAATALVIVATLIFVGFICYLIAGSE